MTEDLEPDTDALSELGRIVAAPNNVPAAADMSLYDDLLAGMQARLEERGAKSMIVVGPVGVGKTTLLRALFRRLALAGYTVLETSTGQLISGMKYIGEWQRRITSLIHEARADHKVIVYFQDLNQVTTVGATETSTDTFATYLRAPVERGELALLGEGTAAKSPRNRGLAKPRLPSWSTPSTGRLLTKPPHQRRASRQESVR